MAAAVSQATWTKQKRKREKGREREKERENRGSEVKASNSIFRSVIEQSVQTAIASSNIGDVKFQLPARERGRD
jgi:hypothetical protein